MKKIIFATAVAMISFFSCTNVSELENTSNPLPMPENVAVSAQGVEVSPKTNYVVVVEAKGSTILELLRQNTALLPVEDGFFPQVSGMKYTVVVADHSIKDVQILNKATGSYEPIEPDKNYTVATIDYCVSGGGFRYVLKDAKILTETNKLYRDMLVDYISDNLKAHIGSQYAEPQGRITIIYPAK